jgi:hypothetical protein
VQERSDSLDREERRTNVSVFNKRNAVLGWVVWQTMKQMAARKARAAGGVEARRRKLVGAAAAAAAAVGGTFLVWRLTHQDEEPPGLEP